MVLPVGGRCGATTQPAGVFGGGFRDLFWPWSLLHAPGPWPVVHGPVTEARRRTEAECPWTWWARQRPPSVSPV